MVSMIIYGASHLPECGEDDELDAPELGHRVDGLEQARARVLEVHQAIPTSSYEHTHTPGNNGITFELIRTSFTPIYLYGKSRSNCRHFLMIWKTVVNFAIEQETAVSVSWLLEVSRRYSAQHCEKFLIIAQ